MNSEPLQVWHTEAETWHFELVRSCLLVPSGFHGWLHVLVKTTPCLFLVFLWLFSSLESLKSVSGNAERAWPKDLIYIAALLVGSMLQGDMILILAPIFLNTQGLRPESYP